MTPAERQQFAKHAINEAMELCHRRWMLRVIWELREGAWTFRALQARCGDLSPTVLNQRLTELREELFNLRFRNSAPDRAARRGSRRHR